MQASRHFRVGKWAGGQQEEEDCLSAQVVGGWVTSPMMGVGWAGAGWLVSKVGLTPVSRGLSASRLAFFKAHAQNTHFGTLFIRVFECRVFIFRAPLRAWSEGAAGVNTGGILHSLEWRWGGGELQLRSTPRYRIATGSRCFGPG